MKKLKTVQLAQVRSKILVLNAARRRSKSMNLESLIQECVPNCCSNNAVVDMFLRKGDSKKTPWTTENNPPNITADELNMGIVMFWRRLDTRCLRRGSE
jgi:hypothetical protein